MGRFCFVLRGRSMEFFINNKKIEIEIKRKKIKNLNLKIKDGKVFVSAPLRYPEKEIVLFINRNLRFIERNLEKSEEKLKYRLISLEDGEREAFVFGEKTKINFIEAEEKPSVFFEGKALIIKAKTIKKAQEAFESFARAELIKIIEPFLEEAKKKALPRNFPFGDIKINIRKVTSRWGTCFCNRGEITFALNLFFAPPECIRYVVFHELCHFTYPNHGKEFHSFLESFVPNERQLRKKLNERE